MTRERLACALLACALCLAAPPASAQEAEVGDLDQFIVDLVFRTESFGRVTEERGDEVRVVLDANVLFRFDQASLTPASLVRGPGITMTSRGLGERDPVADNDTPAGRRNNRRVEVTFSK